MDELKIAVVEDEESCRKMLVDYLTKYFQEELGGGVSFKITTFSNADKFLSAYKRGFQIVFMDICMPGTDGMSAARKLREVDNDVLLIFVTTMARFAVEGYEVNAFNYIVKPVNYYDFKLKIDKAVKKLTNGDNKMRVLTNGEQIWIAHKDIVYIEVMGHNLIFHTNRGDYVSYGSMKQIEQSLNPSVFARCNNCYIVNLSYVDSVKGFDLNLSGGEVLRISQTKRKNFVQTLTKYFGGSL